MNLYQVYVSNLGLVCETDNPVQAAGCYGEYRRLSLLDYGRVAGEDVTLLDRDGEVMHEHLGDRAVGVEYDD